MNLRWIVVLVALAAFGAGAWMMLRPPEMPVLPAGGASTTEAPITRALPATPARRAASTAVAQPASVPVSARSAVSPLYAQFVGEKPFRALYDHLKSTAEGQTPEGQYLLYEILRRCANVSDRTTQRPPTRAVPKREEFVAGLSPADPQREKRLAAFDQMEANRCAGFDNVTVTQAELNRLLESAVAGGDAKARALAVEQELAQQRRAGNRTLTESQIETLRQALGTRDPGAMLIAGRLISNTWQDLTVRIGPEGQVAEPRALYNAWQMLACEYGYPCGADNSYVLTECALRGHCQASGLQDFLSFYNSSLNDTQLLAQYQQILRNAITTGDWSQVALVRGPRPPGAPRAYFPPR
jgi:hypothetical protein